MSLESIYNASPYWVQNVMCSVKGYLINKRRYSKAFRSELERYEKHRYNPQQELLKALFFCKDIPFYKEIWPESFFDDLTIDNVEERIKDLPIISKADVRNRITDFAHPEIKSPSFLMHTSGTTGSGLVFPYSYEMENKQWAVWWRYRRSLGIQIDTWCGWMGGRSIIPLNYKQPPFWRINYPAKQVMYSSYHLNRLTVKCFYDDIYKRKLPWIHGYPSSTTLFASLMIESNLPPIETVRWITTGSENLLEHHMRILQEAFPNAIVRTHYGMAEGVANFSQNIDGDWLIDDDFAHAEFIPVDQNDSSICRIVGTGFSNKAFPLVRYDTGDLAKIKWTEGRPKVFEIYGRQEDYIELPNGVKLGRLDHIFKDCVNINEAQVHQIRKDLIELRVVKGSRYSGQDEALLLKEASSRFGNDVEIKVVYTDHIERTKSGKFKMVVSDIKG